MYDKYGCLQGTYVYVRSDYMAPEGCTNGDKIRYGVMSVKTGRNIMWFNETGFKGKDPLDNAKSAANHLAWKIEQAMR